MSQLPAYPFAAIGDVLLTRVEMHRRGEDSSAYAGDDGNKSGAGRKAATLCEKKKYLDHWKAIVSNAINDKWISSSSSSRSPATAAPPPRTNNSKRPSKPFDVFFAGETALGILSTDSPLHFFIDYSDNTDRSLPPVFSEVAVKQTVGFDIANSRDVTAVAKVVLHFIAKGVAETEGEAEESSRANQENTTNDAERAAMTTVIDRREGSLAFVIKNVPIRPPKSLVSASLSLRSDSEERGSTDAGEGFSSSLSSPNRDTKNQQRFVTIRISLPSPLGRDIHKDTNLLMEYIGKNPFLSPAIEAVLLWAKCQRFYLDDESFIKFASSTAREVALRTTMAKDMYHRAFGTMALCSLLIAAATDPSIVDSCVGLSEAEGDFDRMDERANVGRAFVYFIRFLASKDYFRLDTTPNATRSGGDHSFTLNIVPISPSATNLLSLSNIINRRADFVAGGGAVHDSIDASDVRHPYHYTREVAECTNTLLSTPLEALEEDYKIRFLGAPSDAAAVGVALAMRGETTTAGSISSINTLSAATPATTKTAVPPQTAREASRAYEIEFFSSDSSSAAVDMYANHRRWIDAVLFGVLYDTRNDNAFNDPLRAVRVANRCEECGVGGVGRSMSKGSSYCVDCKIALETRRALKAQQQEQQQRERDALPAAASENAVPATNNAWSNRGGGGGRGSRGGRGAGAAAAATAVIDNATDGSRGRGRGSSSSFDSLPSSPATAQPSRGRGRGRGGADTMAATPSSPATPSSFVNGINYEGICVGCDKEKPYLKDKPITELCFGCT